jgi:uncharacterized membrane protein (Fun14 family)
MFNTSAIGASTARPALKLPGLERKRIARPASALGGGNGGGNNRGGGGGGGGGDGDGKGSGDFGDAENRFNPLARSFALASATLAISSAMSPSAHAGKSASKDAKKVAQLAGLDMGDFAALFTTELGISGAVGVGVGILAKAAAKTALMVLASVYAFLRWLELNDIVDVKWENLRRLVGKTTKLADLNGDGKIDAKDLKLAKAKAVGFFGSAVPSASGLCAGIAIGLKL